MGAANLKKRKRRPTKLEQRVQGMACRRATKQLMRVRWDRFHKAYKEYPRWEALALWVRAIVEIEGSAPSWLAAVLKKRCPGFIKSESLLHEPGLLAFHLRGWIHNEIFGHARQEGWLDALIFYGVRDLRSQGVWAYWEHCEREWNRRRPASYPSFEKWSHTAQNYKPCEEAHVARMDEIVERYVDWQAFANWLAPPLEADLKLPHRIASELESRCPGFLEFNNSCVLRNRKGKATTRQRLMTWIEDHFFSEANKEGWFETVLRQARTHPRYARIVKYWQRWSKSCSQNPTIPYPSFGQWRRAAGNYVED